MTAVAVVALLLLTVAPAQAASDTADFERNTCPGWGDIALEDEVTIDDYKQCKETATRESIIRSIESYRGPIQGIGNLGDDLQESRFGPIQAVGEFLSDWADSQEQRLDEEIEAASPS